MVNLVSALATPASRCADISLRLGFGNRGKGSYPKAVTTDVGDVRGLVSWTDEVSGVRISSQEGRSCLIAAFGLPSLRTPSARDRASARPLRRSRRCDQRARAQHLQRRR